MTRYDDWAANLDPGMVDELPTGSEAEELDRIAGSLSDEALWGAPPASLRDKILAQAMGEAMAGPASLDNPGMPDVPAPRPAPERFPIADASTPAVDPEEYSADVFDVGAGSFDASSSPALVAARARWFDMAVAGVAAAAVAVIAMVAIPLVLERTDGSISTFEVAGTELTPDAEASVDVEPLAAGVAITLNITGLPPAGEGEYYAGWLTSPDGEQVPIGSFHWREGGIPIELWSGVDVERYPTLGITLQREGEPTTSSGVVVLKGSLIEE